MFLTKLQKDRTVPLCLIFLFTKTKSQKYCLLFRHTISNLITLLNSYLQILRICMMLMYSKYSTLSMCHFIFAFLHSVFLNVSSNRLYEKMQSHIGCICFAFLHCEFSNVSSNGLHKRMHSHIDYICLAFLQ